MEGKRCRQLFAYKKRQENYSIDLSQVMYFEGEGRKVKFATPTGEDSFYGKISEIWETLDTTVFWQIHQSIIINCTMVKSWGYETVMMQTGVELPISQSRRKEIRERLHASGQYAKRQEIVCVK